VAVALIALLGFGAVLLRGRLSRSAGAPLDWAGYTWLGLIFYLFLAVLVTEPFRLVIRLLRHRSVVPSGAGRVPRWREEAAPPDGGTAPGRGAIREDRDDTDLPRRLFLARTVALGAGAIALGTAATGMAFANSAPVVRRMPLYLPRLPAELAGLRIVTFSDGHLSPTYGGWRFERVVEMVNAQRPDVVAIVGDLVDGEVDELREDVAPLAHQPVQVEQARAAGVDLQLSGHTHGGRLWPFDYAVRLDQPVVEGWSQQGSTQLYVTAGVGYWGPPMRIGARPEITVIDLQPGRPIAPFQEG
jgi:hypothetical protein